MGMRHACPKDLNMIPPCARYSKSVRTFICRSLLLSFIFTTMLKTKRSRDQAACALIFTIPIVLIVVVFCAIFVLGKESNKRSNPGYVAPDIRSYRSRDACLDFLTQQLDKTTTSIYMPLASSSDYITALRSEGNNSETTIWGLVSKYEFSCTEGQTTLPQPYNTVSLGPSTLTYDYTMYVHLCLSHTCAHPAHSSLATKLPCKLGTTPDGKRPPQPLHIRQQ